ncbi:hypothetical protein H696_05970 [Fonticula alba]|uniref:Uncharacterized protein n=1 Tax=Fonticula alba TaxID=691883 RepID=A0A058Z235_FONAL|nr:hypothetical protein H696_05970 [Fonticula alba]KCV67572.1 hypothetical protein H696_05970 [Fonticula alba]|eukprot:XP_009498013.1 hypothetical protein H696_05970 [Fonticula alba]
MGASRKPATGGAPGGWDNKDLAGLENFLESGGTGGSDPFSGPVPAGAFGSSGVSPAPDIWAAALSAPAATPSPAPAGGAMRLQSRPAANNQPNLMDLL